MCVNPHLLAFSFSFSSHLPVLLLQLVVERLAARHQVLPADLAGSLLPHRLAAPLAVVLLLLSAVGKLSVRTTGRRKDAKTQRLGRPSVGLLFLSMESAVFEKRGITCLNETYPTGEMLGHVYTLKVSRDVGSCLHPKGV